jgi:hypothetical protein
MAEVAFDSFETGLRLDKTDRNIWGEDCWYAR